MDHLCYLDLKEKEYEKLFCGAKTKLARAVSNRKPPFKHVFSGDRIYFVNKRRKIVLSSIVTSVVNAERSDKTEYKETILKHADDLNISMQKVKSLMRKKYLVLIDLIDVLEVKSIYHQDLGSIKRKKWILAGDLRLYKERHL